MRPEKFSMKIDFLDISCCDIHNECKNITHTKKRCFHPNGAKFKLKKVKTFNLIRKGYVKYLKFCMRCVGRTQCGIIKIMNSHTHMNQMRKMHSMCDNQLFNERIWKAIPFMWLHKIIWQIDYYTHWYSIEDEMCEYKGAVINTSMSIFIMRWYNVRSIEICDALKVY